MKRVSIYCRVSSEDQKERDTISNQVETLKAWLDMKKDEYILVNEFLDDGISGSVPFIDRPGGSNALKSASKKEYDILLVWKIDRFGRDTLSGLQAIEEIRKYEVEIKSLTEPFDLNTPTGRFQFTTYLSMAELEKNNILDRMFLGATRAAKQGKWLGGIVPYGYYVDSNHYLEINNIEANVVRKIFDMYINENKKIIDIAVYLNSLGIPSNYAARGTGKNRKGVKKALWSPSSIYRILTNETYMGIHEYGKRGTRRDETIIRNVKPIIPIEVFNKAQKVRKENCIESRRNSPNRLFLLKGLIKCKICGHNYHGKHYSNKTDIYSCAGKKTINKKIYDVKCNSLNIQADMLENAILDKIKDIMLHFDDFVLNNNNSQLEELQLDLISLNNSKIKLNDEKTSILKLYRKNLINDDDLEIQIKDIATEEKNIDSYIKSTKNNIEILKNKEKSISSIKDNLKFYKERINNLNDDEKRNLIKLFIKEITVDTIIEDGEKIPNIDITWRMSLLDFTRTRVQFPRVTKEKATYIYSENIYIIFGTKIKELRLINNTTLKNLSKVLGISVSTLSKVEKGINTSNNFYYYKLYCEHFNKKIYQILDLSLMKKYTFDNKVKILMCYFGCKTEKDLDKILGVFPGAIYDYKRGKSNSKKIPTLIYAKIKEIGL